jgi:hypothetical protein
MGCAAASRPGRAGSKNPRTSLRGRDPNQRPRNHDSVDLVDLVDPVDPVDLVDLVDPVDPVVP